MKKAEKRGTKFLVVGRTGSGKSSIVQAAGAKVVVSYTTRPKREGEVDFADHVFITPEDVKKYKDSMIAYTKIGNYEYFATVEMLDDADCYIIDPHGIESLKKRCEELGLGYRFVTVYIKIPTYIRKRRLKIRGDSSEVIAKRLAAEDEQFSEFERNKNYDYCILNNKKLDDAVSKMRSIMNGTTQ